jgi:hypothetical protein
MKTRLSAAPQPDKADGFVRDGQWIALARWRSGASARAAARRRGPAVSLISASRS